MTKICLDAGHGGKDPGAVGPSGLKEAPVALAIVEYVSESLKSIGLSVLLTRTSDVFVELIQRCALANNWGADYFVSVHLNSDGPSAVGIETLYKTENGKKLATPIQEEMLKQTGDTDRGLKLRENLAVLNGTRMPAVLAEVGFISHPATEAKFRTDDYRKLLATSITYGIAKFLDVTPAPPPIDPPAIVQPLVTITIEADPGVKVSVVRL